jgi:hypothetical protein
MNLRFVIALFLGLVIQLSQAQTFASADSSPACGDTAHPMGCCEGLNSCPCADKGAPNEKPAPLIPATIELKPLVSQAPETICPAPLFSAPTSAMCVTASRIESRSGYAGVSLAVAFCSFVI